MNVVGVACRQKDILGFTMPSGTLAEYLQFPKMAAE